MAQVAAHRARSGGQTLLHELAQRQALGHGGSALNVEANCLIVPADANNALRCGHDEPPNPPGSPGDRDALTKRHHSSPIRPAWQQEGLPFRFTVTRSPGARRARNGKPEARNGKPQRDTVVQMGAWKVGSKSASACREPCREPPCSSSL